MKPFFVLALAAAAMTLAPQPGRASEPPWCLFTKGGEALCRYNSLGACLRDRMGGSDFCNPNPRYETWHAKAAQRQHRH